MPKKTPQRMCVGCREMKSKRELIRVGRTPADGLKIDGKMCIRDRDEEDYTTLYCFISLENKTSIAAVKSAWASTSGRQQLQNWCYDIVSSIRDEYTDYEIFGAVTAYQIFDIPPDEDFEIKKKDPDTGKWLTAQTLWYLGWDEEGFFTMSQKK